MLSDMISEYSVVVLHEFRSVLCFFLLLLGFLIFCGFSFYGYEMC